MARWQESQTLFDLRYLSDAEGVAKFDFVLNNEHNTPVNLLDLKGKVVLLDFWSEF
jgi:cytochrome oxidase Cu insertion factor (SCO1/SenC/PrrC family)